MAELFLELFSEEIPANLQIDARQKIKQIIEERLQKKEIKFNSSNSFSTPQRLVFVIDGIPEKIEEKKKVVNKASDGRFSGKSDIASLVNKVKNRVNQ